MKAMGTHQGILHKRDSTLSNITRHGREEELVWGRLKLGAAREELLSPSERSEGPRPSEWGCRMETNDELFRRQNGCDLEMG